MFAKLLNKYKVHLLILIELIVITLFVPGLLKGNVLCSNLSAEDFAMEESLFTSKAVVIPRGIMRADVYVEPRDDSYYIETKRLDEGTFHGMDCNDIAIFPGQEKVSYEIFVTDKSATISFVAHGEGFDECPISKVEIYNTHKAHSVIMCTLFFLFCCFDVLLLFRKRIVERNDLGAEITFFVLAVCTLISLMPELTNYVSFGLKGMDEFIKIETMRKAIAEHGAFFSNHFKNLYLIIPVILRLIGFPIMIAYKANIFLLTVLTVVVTYKGLKLLRVKGSTALVITVLYILCPFRLYVLYYMCNIGSVTAMVFPPLIIIPLLQLNTEIIKDFISSSFYFAGMWLLACGSVFALRKKKKAVVWIIVLLVIAASWYLGEITLKREAIWLYNIENFYRM